MNKVSVLFVCLGNICRSPTAEGIFRKLVEREALSHVIDIDSAGTSDWHVNEAPDPRTIRVAKTRGVDLSALRGRQVTRDDFNKFDYVLAMDNSNLNNLERLQPTQHDAHLGLFLDFGQSKGQEVPDPYHGGEAGFNHVYDLIDEASRGLLQSIKQKFA